MMGIAENAMATPSGNCATNSSGSRFPNCVCRTAVPIVTPHTCHATQLRALQMRIDESTYRCE